MAVYVPSDCRVLWPSTNATIPANWTRDTDYDDKFLGGASASSNPGTNAGAATHTHTVNTHTHTTVSHNHTLNIRAGIIAIERANITILSPTAFADRSHLHNVGYTVSASPVSGAGTSTIQAATAIPQYKLAILIKPNNATQQIPDDSIVFYNDSSVPSGFYVTDGNNGTDNFDQKFVKMPVALGDGGGTGGAATHIHNAGANHTHSLNHTHADSNFGTPTVTIGRQSGLLAKGTQGVGSHHRATNIQIAVIASNGQTEAWQTAINDPAYVKLLGIQNKSAGALDVEDDMILPFVGNLVDIPYHYLLCDGTNGTPDMRDKQVLVTANTGQIGDTGGSNTHSHNGTNHLHTSVAHNHVYTFTTQGYSGTGISTFIARWNHVHPNNMGSTAITTNNSSSTTQASDIRQPYRTVLFIMRKYVDYTVYIYGADILGADIAL